MARHLDRLGLATALVTGARPLAAWAQQGPSHAAHMWDRAAHGWFFGPAMIVLLIALAVILVVLLVRWLRAPGDGPATHQPAGEPPLDVLKERFARRDRSGRA